MTEKEENSGSLVLNLHLQYVKYYFIFIELRRLIYTVCGYQVTDLRLKVYTGFNVSSLVLSVVVCCSLEERVPKSLDWV